MLTESVLLAAMGGLAGIVFAWWASELLLWMVSTGSDTLPLHVAPDARVLVFTYLLSLATGILFGTRLLPDGPVRSACAWRWGQRLPTSSGW